MAKTVSKKKSGAMMNATEACEFLGIKAQTLYAYVSRGFLRAEIHPGSTGKLYARDELEALQARSRARSGHGATAASAMRWGDPILDSAITCIQNGRIYYRAFPLLDLLQRDISFENTAELLWSGELPQQIVRWTPPQYPVEDRDPAPSSSLSRRLLFRLSRMALLDEEGHDELMDQSLRRARSLIMEAVGELFAFHWDPSPSIGIAARMAQALQLDDVPEARQAIECALVASADHELNASTFAARVAASTGADLYAGILAAMATFSGRQHGLASLEVYDFILQSPFREARKKQLKEWMQSGRSLPGFGHRLYSEGDPRVPPILQKARQLAAVRGGEALRWMQSMDECQTLAQEAGLPAVNLDFGLVAIALALGLPQEGASSLFVIGRLAGWIAHIMEQRQQGFLLRPRARYVGRPPLATP